MTNLSNILVKVAAVTGEKPDEVGDNGNTLTTDVTSIINAIIAALGMIAVVIIIIGGVSYMTSSGDSAKVKKAKDTILYGVIGLIICVLAFAIVNFVISSLLA
ncbi:hypothetical protein IKF02_00195 [Candidatus Saccharibacteria bacterium]|nr:hypothetical protein [Candidatus Saccharibacteria bacterium]